MFSVLRKNGLKVLTFGLISNLYGVNVLAYNSLFEHTLSRKNLVVPK